MPEALCAPDRRTEVGIVRRRSLQNLKHEPKLTWEQVNTIRSDYRWHSSAMGCAALAKRYGVSANTVHKIVHGLTWRVRPGDGNTPLPIANKWQPTA